VAGRLAPTGGSARGCLLLLALLVRLAVALLAVVLLAVVPRLALGAPVVLLLLLLFVLGLGLFASVGISEVGHRS
jgi:hypothetical protein